MFDCLRSMDCSPPGSAVHGITQARHWSGLPFPSLRGSSRPRDQTLLSGISCISRQIRYHCTTGKPSRSPGDRRKGPPLAGTLDVMAGRKQKWTEEMQGGSLSEGTRRAPLCSPRGQARSTSAEAALQLITAPPPRILNDMDKKTRIIF